MSSIGKRPRSFWPSGPLCGNKWLDDLTVMKIEFYFDERWENGFVNEEVSFVLGFGCCDGFIPGLGCIPGVEDFRIHGGQHPHGAGRRRRLFAIDRNLQSHDEQRQSERLGVDDRSD